MSRKEHERGAVMGRVRDGLLSLREAAELLDVSYRHVKRVYRRYREEGAPGLVHRNVGRTSNRARGREERERALDLVREHYGGSVGRGPGQRFGPTLAAEHLWEDHGIEVPMTTLRDWMMGAELWSRVRRSRPKPSRRERREHFGELVQLDGSFHDWFEGRGEREGGRSCVMNMVDDATGHTGLRFGEEETTWAAADILKAWIEKHGVPRALYTDWKNVYKREPTSAEQAVGDPGHTQFGRMCAKLGIEIIAADTPQAKGRVERGNGTQQDRLIKKMRLLGIGDDAAANEYCESTYLPQHNARYAVPPASPVDYHLPRDPKLRDEDVFCLEHTRTVGNDFVVQFHKQGLQLDRSARGRVPAGSKVIVRQTRDGPLRVVHVNWCGVETECPWRPAAPRSRSDSALRVEIRVAAKSGQKYKPGPNHPWRHAPTLASTFSETP
jgi:transposase